MNFQCHLLWASHSANIEDGALDSPSLPSWHLQSRCETPEMGNSRENQLITVSLLLIRGFRQGAMERGLLSRDWQNEEQKAWF